MFRIRIHGRGGQGIKTAGRILGTAFFLHDYQVQDAPRYGAERRGAPIFAYVRASFQPILERGIIQIPDLVAVADETLLPIPAAGVLQGARASTVLLIRSSDPRQEWESRLNFPGRIVVLPVGAETGDQAEGPLTGAVCAGAAAALVGVITAATLEQAIRLELDSLPREALAVNLQRVLAAYRDMAPQAGAVQEGSSVSASDFQPPEWIQLGLEEAGDSAPAIFGAATSVQVRTGLWRTQRPIIDYQACHGCSWICSTLCPDSAIPVESDGRPRIDYDHCKGCMICVAVCPWHAIEVLPEARVPEMKTTGTEA